MLKIYYGELDSDKYIYIIRIRFLIIRMKMSGLQTIYLWR